MDPLKVRPRNGWVLVLADQRPDKTSAGIFLPGHETGAEKVSEGAGELIRIGPGEKNQRLGLEPGMRVLYRGFLKYANPIETEAKWESGHDKEYFIMSCEDLLGIVPIGMQIGIFSGRPQVSEKR